MARNIETMLDFFIHEKGEKVKVNGIDDIALIRDVMDKINYYDDKIIRIKTKLQTGDVVEYQDDLYIVISQVDQNEKSYRARIRRINYNIKIVVHEELWEFIAIIEGMSFGIDEGRFINLQAGKIQVTIPYDNTSNSIDIGMRFIKMKKAWKIVGVDRSRPGLIVLHCEKDVFKTDDDQINEIADKDKIAVWEVHINEESRQLELNKSFPFTATVKKNGSNYQDVDLLWESSHENIAVVDNGIVTGVSIGNVVISVYIKDKPDIITNIDLEIMENPPDVITYRMWSSNTDGSGKSYLDFAVTNGSSKWFGVEKYINGLLAGINDTYSFMNMALHSEH